MEPPAYVAAMIAEEFVRSTA